MEIVLYISPIKMLVGLSYFLSVFFTLIFQLFFNFQITNLKIEIIEK